MPRSAITLVPAVKYLQGMEILMDTAEENRATIWWSELLFWKTNQGNK